MLLMIDALQGVHDADLGSFEPPLTLAICTCKVWVAEEQ
jgi:hypothetical protein